ncbi:YidH family protein [Leekyejoonella antrihumi]|uniref:DUF202 domain-containing protein n=1 Tax=Leekyejoonella antrihumi TaxID=1660198 RepID=A0A563E9T1_9MICO|nr:DUF202 domain-containing protein [Leekyejoonella antrihumi]TWP38554.1 DUF202 domain-containing protein [Leekyejoonella antrihumi]
MSTTSRWPKRVYDVGEDPDYRFSFANERTFLAWIRTSLALLAGGVALDTLSLSIPPAVRRTLACALIIFGMICAGAAWLRWAAAERAMRTGSSLPSARLPGALAGVLIVCALVVLVVVLIAL